MHRLVRPALLMLSIAFTAAACNTAGTAPIHMEGGSLAQRLTQGSGTLSPKANSTLCLTPQGGAKDNGTPIVVAPCDNSQAQQWSADSNGYSVRLFGTKCLDVIDGYNLNGVKLQLWDCFNNDNSQKWSLQNGVLQWSQSGRCMDLTDGVAAAGTRAQIWDCNSGNDNQIWAGSFAELQQAPAQSNVSGEAPIDAASASGASAPGPSP